MRINLDMDVLRTLALAVDHGGFGKAASIIGRSQSAVSLQMRRLEDQTGVHLFRRQGRAMVLTDSGEVLLAYGRKILALNDEALAAVRGAERPETVRLGLPADLSESFLSQVLARFAESFPSLQIEARVDRNANLVDQIGRSELDLALAFGEHAGAVREVSRLPIHWIAGKRNRPGIGPDVPLVLFDAPCLFRDVGISALKRKAIGYRVALTSASLSGLWAATEAGLGVSIRTRLGLPESLDIVDTSEVLPPIEQSVRLALYQAPGAQSASIEVLRTQVLETIETLLPQAA